VFLYRFNVKILEINFKKLKYYFNIFKKTLKKKPLPQLIPKITLILQPPKMKWLLQP
jgi:hypothetical protein